MYIKYVIFLKSIDFIGFNKRYSVWISNYIIIRIQF